MWLSQLLPLLLLLLTNQGGAQSTACKDLSPVCYAIDKNYCNEASLQTFCKDACGLCSKDDSSCECGVANEASRKKRGSIRIVGGREALRHKYPWIVVILMKNGEAYNQCGGSIINTRYILTAGHCTYKKICRYPYSAENLLVTVAEHNVASINDDVKGVTERLKVTKIIRHEDYCTNPYSSTTFNNDIALLLLPKDLDLTARELSLVCLPEKASSTYEGKTVWAAGWGITRPSPDAPHNEAPMPDSLLEVSFEVHNDCRNYKYRQHITGNMFCGGDNVAVKDACGGDSGGPLMYKDENNRYIQIGIVSFGPPGGNCTGLGIYTAVTHYIDWIKRNTRDGKCH